MIQRAYGPRLRRLLSGNPAVTVLGPRQCGKTTFIRQALPDWTYLDLERPSDAIPLSADPEARLEQLGDRVILDEAQSVPGLFPVLRGLIDRRGSRRCRYVLLGSASPALVRALSESLAGRTAFLDLPPFRLEEVARGRPGALASLWYRGGYPRAFLEQDDRARQDWVEAYVRAFIERDLPALGLEVSAAQMRKLWTMLAHYNGGIWNASAIASSLGVSYHTVNRYADILEQTFLVRMLPPYFANIGKRLVRRPKVYFRDSGLLHHFLGIDSSVVLDVHPSRGASFEGFVVDQLATAFERVRPGSRCYFWRTGRGEEVDLLVEKGARRIPFEVKTHSAPSASDAPGLIACMKDLGLDRGYLVHGGRQDYSLGGGVMALSAERLLVRPSRVARL